MLVEHVLPDASEFPHRLTVGSAARTRAFGAQVADLLAGGEILLLHGPLGAGKTCFVQGMCRALGVTEDVTSPTFTLANRYAGRLVVHHLDFYRLDDSADLADIGLDAILDEVGDGQAVLAAEWPARLAALAPRRLEFLATLGPAPASRTWHWRGVPDLPTPWAVLAGVADHDRGDRSC